MTKLTDSLFAVEVPEDARDFSIWDDIVNYWINPIFDETGKVHTAWQIRIPKGSYTILGTIKHGKPDFDVEEYVEKIESVNYKGSFRYKNYYEGTKFNNATDSFLSLLTYKKLDTKKHWLILKIKYKYYEKDYRK